MILILIAWLARLGYRIIHNRTTHHLAAYHAARTQMGPHGVNINTIHQTSLTRNDRIAAWVAGVVGTMWFCYALAVLITAWATLQGVLGYWHAAWDAYPYSFLFFCLGGIMQSLLMPLIMVAQNLESRRSELQAENDFHVNQASLAILQGIQGELVLLHQIKDLLVAPGTPLPADHQATLTHAAHTINLVLHDITHQNQAELEEIAP